MGYTLKVLSTELWIFFNPKDFETGILDLVNEGGDADTNASVGGSLLGAKFGFGSIPVKYIDELNDGELLIGKFEGFVEVIK
ncbi:ADP-ribosylglycohydrolase family protein [Pseudopedobacter saltans]|uniref:ADP-ribosylglycohydrolase family protein n=1 Tax=Pseudopedobacter saltans TaxID=151895 RepID=UPI000A03860C